MFQHFIGDVYVFDEPPEEEFDFVDIPVFTQDEQTSLGLLIQLDDEDLNERSRERVKADRDQRVLSFETIQANAHVDPYDQTELAKVLLRRGAELNRSLAWRGQPTWEELVTTCELLFRCLVKKGKSGVYSGRQLAFRLWRLSMPKTTRQFIEDILEIDKNIATPDTAVEAVFEFTKQWANYYFPKYLSALERIQNEIYGRMGFGTG